MIDTRARRAQANAIVAESTLHRVCQSVAALCDEIDRLQNERENLVEEIAAFVDATRDSDVTYDRAQVIRERWGKP